MTSHQTQKKHMASQELVSLSLMMGRGRDCSTGANRQDDICMEDFHWRYVHWKKSTKFGGKVVQLR